MRVFLHHRSYRQEILDASRRKFSIRKEDAQRLIEEEEATIIRSAEEKAAIEGKRKIQKKKNRRYKASKTEAEPMI